MKGSKKNNYLLMNEDLDNLLEIDHNIISILANASALLNERISNINWVGFYILQDDTLYLGPFQGKVACNMIRVGYGVCGTSVQIRETLLVDNVHEFPGHIACDEESNSEIVIPIFIDGKIYGVLDLDSKKYKRFSKIDQRFLEQTATIIAKHLNRELSKN